MGYKFDNIAGYKNEKEELMMLCKVIKKREEIKAMGGNLPRGIIFYGESGTGKTLFMKVLAEECGLNIIEIDLTNEATERQVVKIGRAFRRAASRKNPSIIFFDEIDKYLPSPYDDFSSDTSKAVLAELLTLIDGLGSSGNFIFAATCNDYEALPDSLVRPGRIDKKLHIGLPNYESRMEIAKYYIGKTAFSFDISLSELARITAGFSCAAIETLINECVLSAAVCGAGIDDALIESKIRTIKNEDIDRKPSGLDAIITATSAVGAFAVARRFNRGHYHLTTDNESVSNYCYDSIIKSFASYDDDDYYDDEEDEEEDVETGEFPTYVSRYEVESAITALYGAYCAEEVIFGRIYTDMRERLNRVESLLLEMSTSGLFGYAHVFNGQRNYSLSYEDRYMLEINRMINETRERCYQAAKKIVEEDTCLIKYLALELARTSSLSEERTEALIAEYMNSCEIGEG